MLYEWVAGGKDNQVRQDLCLETSSSLSVVHIKFKAHL